MAKHKTDLTPLLLMGAAGFGVYLLWKNQAQPTPTSIYPTLALAQGVPAYGMPVQTTMAAQPGQKTTATIIPTPYYSSVQSQEQGAVLTQCAGAYPGCSILSSDTQLGF